MHPDDLFACLIVLDCYSTVDAGRRSHMCAMDRYLKALPHLDLGPHEAAARGVPSPYVAAMRKELAVVRDALRSAPLPPWPPS